MLALIEGELVYGYRRVSGEWFSECWYQVNGKRYKGINDIADLVEVKEKKVVKLWINIDEGGYVYSYHEKYQADIEANNDRIACKYIEIEYYEGEGL